MSRKNTFYDLLPTIYKIKDIEQGEPLKALLDILEAEAGKMEENIGDLLKNWFIETCDEWAVPYIGDLLGVRNLHQIAETASFSRRAYVANTISYRRRKGTAPVLEQLALDTTGWRARAVEFFQLLETSQNFNHIRINNKFTPDLRDTAKLELLNSAFDTIAHTAEVRKADSGRGWYNIRNIGLFIWRIQSYSIEKSAVYTKNKSKGQYIINPFGLPVKLFNQPLTETNITHLAEEINVPAPLRKRALHDELENRRQSIANGKPYSTLYFGDNDTLEDKFKSVIKIYLNDNLIPVPAEEIMICRLDNWKKPPTSKTYTKQNPDGSTGNIGMTIRVAIDPETGRLAFSDPAQVDKVNISYSYGFSADIGGGPYDRRHFTGDFLSGLTRNGGLIQIGVSKNTDNAGSELIYNSINKAIDKWNNRDSHITRGIITILDSESYAENFKPIRISANSQLLIVAAYWAHLKGDIKLEGSAGADLSDLGRVQLDGLLLEGQIIINKDSLDQLEISNCTVSPGSQSILIDSNCDYLRELSIKRSITGKININTDVQSIQLKENIIDSGDSPRAIEAPGSGLVIESCTIFGEITGMAIEAGNSIFNHKLIIERQQIGCIRFSYVSIESKTPRRYKCQPEIIRQGGSIKAKENIVPDYSSKNYGHYAYGQLSMQCSKLIRHGADDGSEMGVFNFLKQPQRETNLRTALDEYLRLGLEAGIIYMT